MGKGDNMKNFKFILSALLSVTLIVSVFTVAPSSTQAKDYYYLDNGLTVKGRTMLPMRDLFETIGAPVHWDQKTKSVTATKSGKKIVLKIGSKQATMNGKVLALDVPVVVIDGTTYVPVRFVAESLGAQASYKPEFRETTLTMKDAEIKIYVSPAYNVGGLDTKFRPNPSYIYEFIPYEGLDRRTFVGMRGNGYVWKNEYTYVVKEPAYYSTYKETKDGLYVTHDGYPTQRLIKYPVYVGQSWTNNYGGEYITSTIVSTGIRYNTAAKQFTNVIEILDSDGIYSYYAADFGFIGFQAAEYDYSGDLVLLKKR